GFFKALRNLAKDGRSSKGRSPLVMQQDDRELDGNAPAILGQSGHGQEVALAVMTFAGCHYPIVCRPVAYSERLSGMIKSRELPTASSAVKPKMRTAPGFQKLIRPLASVAMIASETVLRIASIRPCGTL